MLFRSDMPKSLKKDITWKTEAMMRRPPEAPTARIGPLSSFMMIGHMLHSGRLPGATALGVPGRGSNHIMPLFITMPVPGRMTRLPSDDISVYGVLEELRMDDLKYAFHRSLEEIYQFQVLKHQMA